MKSKQDITQKISEIIQEKGIKKVGFHHITGYGRPRINDILKGESDLTYDFLRAACELTGKDITYFTHDEVKPGMENVNVYLDRIQKLTEENILLKIENEELKKMQTK
jgi:transcriptional regulator with XRE-family HTH domain